VFPAPEQVFPDIQASSYALIILTYKEVYAPRAATPCGFSIEGKAGKTVIINKHHSKIKPINPGRDDGGFIISQEMSRPILRHSFEFHVSQRSRDRYRFDEDLCPTGM
jgi:hypothetical protein